MTTLIIHPALTVQRKSATRLAQDYLSLESPLKLETPPPDLHFIDGTLVSSIGIDDVRALIRSLQYHPYQSPIQVGLILMANMLTEEAQNSLLKTLEEPTEFTKFILTTPHEKFLLPTILSRSQKVYIKEKIIPRPQTEEEIAPDIIPIETFVGQDLVEKFLYIETLVNEDKETPGTIAAFLGELTQFYREALLSATRTREDESVTQHSADLKRISRAMHYINRNANKRLTLENLILHLEPSIMTRRKTVSKS